MHVGEAEVAALETVGEPFVVEAELMQQRGVQVVDVDGIAHHADPSSSVWPKISPGFVPPPASHMVNAST